MSEQKIMRFNPTITIYRDRKTPVEAPANYFGVKKNPLALKVDRLVGHEKDVIKPGKELHFLGPESKHGVTVFSHHFPDANKLTIGFTYQVGRVD